MVYSQSVIAGFVMNVRHCFEDLVILDETSPAIPSEGLVDNILSISRVTLLADHTAGVVDESTDRAGKWLRMLHALTQTLWPFVQTNLICLRGLYGLRNLMQDKQKAQKLGPKEELVAPRTPPAGDELRTQSSPAAE